MESPGQKVNVALAICGILAGFGITFAVLIHLRGGHPPPAPDPSPGRAAAEPSISHQGQGQGQGAGPSPAALDAQWLGYSDRSTCADWAGGDGVSAIRLSSSQIAWFFADTYLGPAGPTAGFSHLSGFLHNSLVVQTTNGSQTSLVTLTGGGACTSPSDPGQAESVVQGPTADEGQERYWDADGIKVGGTVVKFYNAYLLGQIPYVPVGTTIATFSVSQLSAAGRGPAYGGVTAPKLTPVPTYTPPGGGTPIIWGSALLAAGPGDGTVYVYGWQSPSVSSPVRLLYLARVSATRLADLAAWQFYAAGQWVGSQSLAQPIEPVGGGLSAASGFSVVRIAGRYWLIQAPGAGDPDIYAYPAPAPWGPFDTGHGILLYRAPGIGLNVADDYRVMYEARAEPALSTSRTLVISYNVNTEAVTGACMSLSHFTNAMAQPRFITVPLAAFSGPPGAVQRLVRAGAPGYPQISEQDPAQWYNSWSFPSGCPPVPGVSRVTARASAGMARLTWPSAGIGVRYQIYVGSASGFVHLRTVFLPHAVLTGLTRGLTYEFQVVPMSIYSSTGPAADVFVRIP
jgi:hypothetical protein